MEDHQGGLPVADVCEVIHLARPKKDGEHISLYFDRELLTKLRALAEKQGWSLVTAFERSVRALLEQYEKKEK